MRRIVFALTLLLAMAGQAQALTTQDILALVAMPLATAAVSDLSVSQNDLATVATDFNQANMPPAAYVQVIRYVPVALAQPQSNFVQYVNTQTSRGLTGESLADAIAQELASNYGVTPQIDPNQPVVVDQVVEQSYIPQFGNDNLSSFALMPLAVAAVSDLNGVPQDQLATLVMSLNQANVPPAQFVQVMRYVPVALVDQNGQPFIAYVQQQVAQGITGPALVTLINQQLPNYGIPQEQISVYAPPPQLQPRYTYAPPPPLPIDQQTYFPPAVQQRFARAQTAAEMNPHGGPPGQLKRIEGVQTGAEVVHGFKPGHGRGRFEGGMPPGLAKRQVLTPPPMASGAPPLPMNTQRIPPGQLKKMERQQAPVAAPPPDGVPPGQAKKQEDGDGKGHDNGHDHGNGHGHGKD